MARKRSSAKSAPGQDTPNQRHHISRGEQGVVESDDGKLLEVKTDQHVLDPESDEAVQVPDEIHELNKRERALRAQRAPSPEEVFSGDADAKDDGVSSGHEN